MASDAQPSDPRASLPAAISAVAAGGGLDHQLSQILAVAAEALSPAMGAVFLADPDRATLSLAASVGMDDDAIDRLAIDVLDPTHPFAAASTERAASFGREATTPSGAVFVGAYLPLMLSSGGVETSLGSIGFGWPAPHDLSDAETATLSAFAALAAVAADRARLSSTVAERSEWFERMAHSDPLTGLANDRTVARVLELELARAGRQGGEVSLAMFDIDDFRTTNIEGGHAAGDDVLRKVAAVLAESVRLVDTVGRIGGDEFVLIAPGSAGMTVAQRVLAGIAALPAVAGKDVSVSAGVARFPADGGDADSLIAAATAALAQARAEGRGHIAETEAVTEG